MRRGQAAEYIIVFAAVVAMAVTILAQAYPDFPRLTYDVGALVNAVSAGYSYELNTFRDGAISHYYVEYPSSGKDINVHVTVLGWPLPDINAALRSAYQKIGYNPRVVSP